ncbi:hypothetical protein HK405_006424 [Cladochytrium tenue]|nr:hypothetical protein HK405_006424 [Cladochytrium tenue]
MPVQATLAISWTVNADGSYWAFGCDWSGNDLTSALTSGSDCGPTCIATPGCTNFAWTDFNGGTCWMKAGGLAQSAAVSSSTSGIICGGTFSPSWTTDSEGTYWAPNCDFSGNDIKDVLTTASNCGPTCAATSGTSSLPHLAQFWKNSLYWGRATAPKVGCFPECGGVASAIQSNNTFFAISGGSVTQFSKDAVKASSNAFSAVDVLYVTALDIGQDADTTYYISTVRSWLENGGTVLLAAIDWVWTTPAGRVSSTDPANLLLEPYGVRYSNDFYSTPTTSVTADIYTANTFYDVSSLVANSGAIDFSNKSAASYVKFASVADNIKHTRYGAVDSTSTFGKALLELSKVCTVGVNWTTLPIASTDYKRRSCCGLLYGLRNNLPIAGHPLIQAAAAWPGVPATTVPLTSKTWTLSPTHTKWNSAHLYVVAGSSVTVKFCAASGVSSGAVAGVQIGSTSDEVARDDDWARFPIIHESSTAWVADGSCQIMTVTSYFGGLLFLDVTATGTLGTVTVTGNVTAAPFFDGSQTADAWNKALQTSLASYAEIEANGIILSYPLFVMKQAPCSTNPADVKAFFDELIPQYFNLSGETGRPYKERLNLDRDISAGGYHSGYAVAWWIGADFPTRVCMMRKSIYESDALNVDGELWGYAHELGHNFQKAAWTDLENNVEVSNNVFTIYMQELFPASLDQFGDANSFGYNSSGYLAEIAWRASTADYASADAFLKLHFYINLRHSFGYEAFRRVFRAYLAMSSPPTAQQDEIDTWATTFSNTVGYDISGFMTNRWRIAVSSSAAAALASLPAYNVSTIVPCSSTKFPFGLSPCASASTKATSSLTLAVSTWATLRVQFRLAVGLSGSSIPSFRTAATSSKAVNTTVALSGASAALFGNSAAYYEPAGTSGQAVLYLHPAKLIPFDTGLNVTVDFSAAATKFALGSTISTSYWMENLADGSLYMLDKRDGAAVTF